jgi:hypothetical protein
MSKAFRKFFPNSIFILALAMNTAALADEGMWLFNAPPLKQLKEKYQFEPSPQWLEHLQKSSVRFNSGGSGSFVSPNGSSDYEPSCGRRHIAEDGRCAAQLSAGWLLCENAG